MYHGALAKGAASAGIDAIGMLPDNLKGLLSASSGVSYVYDGIDQRIAISGGSNPSETIYFAGQAIAMHNPGAKFPAAL